MGRISHVKRRLLLLAWISYTIMAQNTTQERCPRQCFCHRFYHPSDGPCMRVQCSFGGLHSMPIQCLVKEDVHQFIINPPANDPNFITIGPALTQPVPYSSLRQLSILHSNILYIGQFTFWGLVNLKTLNLSGNNITSISMDNFRGLVNLTTLTLDYNCIDQIASESFRYMESLTRLTLSHNRISELAPRLFRMLGKLDLLDLSFNPLNDLNPEVFKDTQNVKKFKCRKCLLRRINVQIYHIMPLIEELDIGDNLFKFITKDDFSNLKKLRKLQIDQNQITVIVDDVFKQNVLLEHLDVSHNRIALLTPGSLNKLSKLNHLDISYNRLEKFRPQTFASVVKSLRTINFSGNKLPLNEISVVLQMLQDIEVVRLENISLESIPPKFFMFNRHLVTLDISSNKLTHFPYHLLLNTRILHDFDISHNKLTSLKIDHLRRLEAIPNVNLANNPWSCDRCSVLPMLNYMRVTVLNSSIRILRCHSPMRLRGVYFADLKPGLLDSCFASYEVKMSIAAGLMLVLGSVVATAVIALYCTRRPSSQNMDYNYTDAGKRLNCERDHSDELGSSTDNSVSTIHSSQHQQQNSS